MRVLVWWMCGLLAATASPFSGGAGDGHGAFTLFNQRIDGTIQPQPLALGGVGDGFSAETLANRQLGPALDNTWNSIAMGGVGDGHSSEIQWNQKLGTPDDEAVSALALGGTGDGFGSATALNLTITPPSPTELFLGGIGDGFASHTAWNLKPGPPPDPAWNAVALGGSGDGFDAQTLTNLPLGPPADSEWDFAFLGGAGDGFDSQVLNAFPLTSAMPPLAHYLGGTGDGFSSLTLWNFQAGGISISPLAYLGGTGDGFDSQTYFNHPFEFRLGSPVDFNQYALALFSPQQIAAGLADPTADADGDGIPNLIEFILGTDPQSGSNQVLPMGLLASPGDYGLEDDGMKYLTLDVALSPFAQGVRIGVQFSSSMDAAGWNSDTCVPLIDTPSRLVVRDCQPLGSQPARFARIVAESLAE